MPARVDQPAEKKTLGDSEQALQECSALEADLAELKANYEQFFIGIDRVPPSKKHDAIKKRMSALKGLFLRQTAVKFRVQAVAAKLVTYERLWDRTIKEIEAGTYKRDLFKVKLHSQKRAKPEASAAPEHIDEDLDLSDLDETTSSDLEATLAKLAAPMSLPELPKVSPPAAPVKAVTTQLPALKPVTGELPQVRPPSGSRPIITPTITPAIKPPATGVNPALKPALPPKPPADHSDGLSEQKIKAIYEAYVMAKKRCGEDTRSITLDSVSSTLKKQVPVLLKQHNARSVEFKVVIKDGKAVLRALPKDS